MRALPVKLRDYRDELPGDDSADMKTDDKLLIYSRLMPGHMH